MVDYELIEEDQNKLWRVPVTNLKEGDLFWLMACGGYEPEMYITNDSPLVVDNISNGTINYYIYNIADSINIDDKIFVYKAPSDYNQNIVTYQSPKYWLDKAKELGLK